MARIVTNEELARAIALGPTSPVYLLADMRTVVKTSPAIRVTEAHTMKFVRVLTNIPVPEVYNVYEDEASGHTRIVMEYIDGVSLDLAWPTMTEEAKESVVRQLRGYWDELRKIEGCFIGGVDSSACDDHFFSSMDLWEYGPFKNEDEFNLGLVRAWTKERDDPRTHLVARMWLNTMKGHKIVMTHGDFAADNILVRGDKVVGILGWAYAGFYPEYWEFCKAHWCTDLASPWIQEGVIERVLDPYYQELALILHTERFW
ncbi:hypothetical protein VTI74DRAFT_11137 [Chaetomium olivicolor]